MQLCKTQLKIQDTKGNNVTIDAYQLGQEPIFVHKGFNFWEFKHTKRWVISFANGALMVPDAFRTRKQAVTIAKRLLTFPQWPQMRSEVTKPVNEANVSFVKYFDLLEHLGKDTAMWSD